MLLLYSDALTRQGFGQEARTDLIRDGELSPACVQTCPADALVFGNLLDAQSRVSKMIKQARAYQVLSDLNTKPAVIYLKKVTQVLT